MSNIKINETQYASSQRFRKTENLHIVFWLFKDLAWCLNIKWLGMAMILPTLIISIVITKRTSNILSEFYHNIAVTLWIIANSYWMISEFFGFDVNIIINNVTYKHIALIPFSVGIFMLGYYYLWVAKKSNINNSN